MWRKREIMTMTEEKMLELWDKSGGDIYVYAELVAQSEQEPVAWMNDMGTHIDLNVSGRGTPLYTTPPQRTWVGLTEEERDYFTYIDAKDKARFRKYADYIEAKLKEKNDPIQQ